MKNLISNVLVLVEFDNDFIDQRFTEAFNSAWSRIPPHDRKAIYRFLKERPGRVFLCYSMDYDDRPAEPWGRISWYDQQTIFTFHAACVEGATPIEVVCCVIAHELAHCHRKATSTWTIEEAEEERGVREVTESWGFDEPVLPYEGAFTSEIRGWQEDNAVPYGKYTEKYILSHLASRP